MRERQIRSSSSLQYPLTDFFQSKAPAHVKKKLAALLNAKCVNDVRLPLAQNFCKPASGHSVHIRHPKRAGQLSLHKPLDPIGGVERGTHARLDSWPMI